MTNQVLIVVLGVIQKEDSEIGEAESEENEASERKRWNPIVRTGKPKGPRWRKNCFRKKFFFFNNVC